MNDSKSGATLGVGPDLKGHHTLKERWFVVAHSVANFLAGCRRERLGINQRCIRQPFLAKCRDADGAPDFFGRRIELLFEHPVLSLPLGVDVVHWSMSFSN